jgi:hypothetical protein
MTRLPQLERSLREAAVRIDPERTTRHSSSRRRSRRTRLIAIATVACLGLAGVALSSDRGWIPERKPPLRVSKSQAERDYAFSKFGALSDESLRPPDAVARALVDPINERMAAFSKQHPGRDMAPRGPLDPAKTRLVHAGFPKIYLLAGQYELCMVTVEIPGRLGSGGCGDPYSALGRDGLGAGVTVLARGFRVTVRAPDPVKTIKVQRFDGSVISMRLEHNVATKVFVRKPTCMLAADDLGKLHVSLFRRLRPCRWT